MGMILRLLFVLALVAVPVVMWATSTGMPARVATHFGGNGLANGWMSKDGYLLFMLIMTTVFPLVVAAATGLIPAAGRSLIAKRSGTMSPQRLETTLRWLAGYATIVGSLIVFSSSAPTSSSSKPTRIARRVSTIRICWRRSWCSSCCSCSGSSGWRSVSNGQ